MKKRREACLTERKNENREKERLFWNLQSAGLIHLYQDRERWISGTREEARDSGPKEAERDRDRQTAVGRTGVLPASCRFPQASRESVVKAQSSHSLSSSSLQDIMLRLRTCDRHNFLPVPYCLGAVRFLKRRKSFIASLAVVSRFSVEDVFFFLRTNRYKLERFFLLRRLGPRSPNISAEPSVGVVPGVGEVAAVKTQPPSLSLLLCGLQRNEPTSLRQDGQQYCRLSLFSFLRLDGVRMTGGSSSSSSSSSRRVCKLDGKGARCLSPVLGPSVAVATQYVSSLSYQTPDPSLPKRSFSQAHNDRRGLQTLLFRNSWKESSYFSSVRCAVSVDSFSRSHRSECWAHKEVTRTKRKDVWLSVRQILFQRSRPCKTRACVFLCCCLL